MTKRGKRILCKRLKSSNCRSLPLSLSPRHSHWLGFFFSKKKREGRGWEFLTDEEILYTSNAKKLRKWQSSNSICGQNPWSITHLDVSKVVNNRTLRARRLVEVTPSTTATDRMLLHGSVSTLSKLAYSRHSYNYLGGHIYHHSNILMKEIKICIERGLECERETKRRLKVLVWNLRLWANQERKTVKRPRHSTSSHPFFMYNYW